VVANKTAAATKEKKEAFMTVKGVEVGRKNEQLVCPSQGKCSAKLLSAHSPPVVINIWYNGS
jgi:hypothetical protein